MFQKSRNIIDCHIAGFTFYDGIQVIDQLKIGTPLTLQIETDNPYDPDTVAIYYKDTKLGYVTKAKNAFINMLLYWGYGDLIEAQINAVDPLAKPEHQYSVVVRIKDNRKK
jgi:hypothetical protein